jgi:hypothetical protein
LEQDWIAPDQPIRARQPSLDGVENAILPLHPTTTYSCSVTTEPQLANTASPVITAATLEQCADITFVFAGRIHYLSVPLDGCLADILRLFDRACRFLYTKIPILHRISSPQDRLRNCFFLVVKCGMDRSGVETIRYDYIQRNGSMTCNTISVHTIIVHSIVADRGPNTTCCATSNSSASP